MIVTIMNPDFAIATRYSKRGEQYHIRNSFSDLVNESKYNVHVLAKIVIWLEVTHKNHKI